MRLSPIIRALRFRHRSTFELEAISRTEWPFLLLDTDREGLTLPLGMRCRGLLPPLIEARIEHNLERNGRRHSRLLADYAEIAAALRSRSLEFAMLKGLSKSRYYAADLRYRPQYDIDIYLPENALILARHAMEELGYEALPESHSRDADHLPRMIRKTGWKWSGDYYDPEMPTAVELHFAFWNEREECFSVGDLSRFWTRRVVREVAGLQLPALSCVDTLSYSSLHLIRHLLRGDLQIYHVYEMAHFLDRSASDNAFWSEWSGSGLESCCVVEAIAFRLAAEWFHCSLHSAPHIALEQLPDTVQRWFNLFGASPDRMAGQPHKDELLLHLCLIPERGDRRKVVIRRLFPVHHGRVVLDSHVPQATRLSLAQRLRGLAFEARFLLRRMVHHAFALVSILWSGFRWWRDDVMSTSRSTASIASQIFLRNVSIRKRRLHSHRPAAERRTILGGSLIKARMARVSNSTSGQSTSRPLRPSSTISGIPPDR